MSQKECCKMDFGMKYVTIEGYPYSKALRQHEQINFCFNLLSLAKALLKDPNAAAGLIGARFFVHEAESFYECNIDHPSV